MQPMTDPLAGRRFWLAFVAVLAVAAGARAAYLGKWAFASDELGSFKDIERYRNPPTGSAHPDEVLPQVIPLSMLALNAGHTLFGSDEGGCRVVVALFGLAHVAVVVLGLSLVTSRTVALTAGLLLALSVEHIFYSQYHRFYTLAALLAGCATLAAARSVKVGSAGWMAAACVFACLAVLAHTLVGTVFGILLVGGLIAAFAGTKRPLLVAVGGSVVALAWLALVVLPVVGDKAGLKSWTGYSSAHAVFGAVGQVSWPVCLLAIPGLAIMWKRDRSQALFWAAAGCVWAGSAVVLPKVLPYHPAYIFPLMLPVFVFAAVAVAEIVSAIRANSGSAAAILVWLLLPLLNLPSLASYYQDGNRHDFRAAAAYLTEHIGPNDRILSNELDKLLHYRPELRTQIVNQPRSAPPSDALAMVPPGGRLWVVCSGGRNGFEASWEKWVYANCHQDTVIGRSRYDYYAFPVWVFRTPPK